MKVRLENKSYNSPVHIIWGPIALLFLAGAGIFRDFLVFVPPCLFHRITGLPCLTCGATRSAVSLSSFDLSSSLFYNPLLPLFVVALMLLSISTGAGYVFKRKFVLELTKTEKKSLRTLTILAILGNWAYLIIAGI